MPWSKKTYKKEPHFEIDSAGKREITWADATRIALIQSMKEDGNIFVMGQGVDDPIGIFGITRNLHKIFGNERVFDTPLSESGLTGIAIGAAQAGMKPVYFHNRPDFLFLALDQLANHAAKWFYMFGGQINVSLVVWACIGRGWGGAAQHSQSPQATFAHFPGLKVVMPGSCQDARDLLLSAIRDPNPVIIIDQRQNLGVRGQVSIDSTPLPLDKGRVLRKGRDVSIVATSHLLREAWLAAELLASEGIEAEIYNPRSLAPLDRDGILNTLKKTGRLVVVDGGSFSYGFTAEVAALASSDGFPYLRAPVVRIAAPDLPVPAGETLEKEFFFGKEKIYSAVLEILK